MHIDLLERDKELNKLKYEKEKSKEDLKAFQYLNKIKEEKVITMREVVSKEVELEEKLKN